MTTRDEANISSELYGLIAVIQSSCDKFSINCDADIRYISQRSTEPIIKAIEMLCDEIFRHYIEIDSKDEDEINLQAYNYLVYFTHLKARWMLQKSSDYSSLYQTFEDKQILVSPYLLVEILWRLHYDTILCRSMLYLPVDLCAQILEILPKCILMLNFSRAVKFISTIVPCLYKKLDHLHYHSHVTDDITIACRKLSCHLCEIVSLFNSERLLNFKDMPKLNIHERKGIVLKALARISIKCCVKEEQLNFAVTKGNYAKENMQKLSSDCLLECRDDIHKHLISILLHKVQEVDCNCYMDWTEFDDVEQPAWSLQRAIGIECHYLLRYSAQALSGESYELLVKALQQISVTPPENAKCNYKIKLNENSVLCDILQDLLEDFLKFAVEGQLENKDDDFSCRIDLLKKIMAKLSMNQLIDFMHTAVPKVLDKSEHLSKINDDGFLDFDRKIFNQSFDDLHAKSKEKYRNLLINLILQPSKTIVEMTKLALFQESFNFQSIEQILDILKLPMPNFYSNVLQNLIKSSGMKNEEKEDIVKLNDKVNRSTVPLALYALRKIAVCGFNSCQPQLSIYLDYLVDKDITDVDVLFEEVLLPLLLLPSYSLSPVLSCCQNLAKVYKPRDPLYHQLLVRLLKKLPGDRSSDRYHVSKLLSQAHDLLKSVFNEEQQPINSKYNYLNFMFRNEFGVNSSEYSEESLSRDILRYELLYASESQCFKYMNDLIITRGSNFGLLNKTEIEIFDILIQTVFEACLLSLEFPAYFPSNSWIFILELLYCILLVVMEKNVIKVCHNLNKHKTLLDEVMKKNTLSRHWEKLTTSWQLKAKKISEWIKLLREFINEADSSLQVAESPVKSPLSIKFLQSERIISHLDLKNNLFLLNHNFVKCFKLKN